MKTAKIAFVLFTLAAGSPVLAATSELDRAVSQLTRQLTRDVPGGPATVAVPAFLTFDKKGTVLGRLLSEKLLNRFSASKKWVPVERDFIRELAGEMKLGLSGAMDAKTAQQLGKFAGASYVVVGTIQSVGDEFAVFARLVRTETARIEKTVEASFPSSPEIESLFARPIELEPKVEERRVEAAARVEPVRPALPTLVITQADYARRPAARGLELPARADAEAQSRNDSWQRRREQELRELDRRIADYNAQAALRREERESRIDREGQALWKQHQDDYQRMIDRFNAPKVKIYHVGHHTVHIAQTLP